MRIMYISMMYIHTISHVKLTIFLYPIWRARAVTVVRKKTTNVIWVPQCQIVPGLDRFSEQPNNTG